MKTLFVAFCLFALTSAVVIQHKLHKIVNPKSRILRNGRRIPTSMLDVISQRTNNHQYTINITLGTPDQSFSVALDTVSSAFMIHDIAACSACPSYCKDPDFCSMVCNAGCCSGSFATKLAQSKCTGFNSVRSKTYISTGQTISNNDTLDFIGQDTFRIGTKDSKQLVIPKTIFVQRTVLPPYDEGYDGILGLGFGTTDGNVSSPLLNAIGQGLLDQPLVSIYIAPFDSAFSRNADGTLTWGGLDSKHCSSDPIQYHKSISPSNFAFSVDSVFVGNYQIPNAKYNAVLNNGAYGITGPTTAVAYIAQQLQAFWASDYSAYIISCNATESIDFTIDGIKYSVDIKNMLSPAEKNCVLALQFDRSDKPTWQLGLAWFQSYCNVFNYETKSVGFVKTIN